MAKKENEKKVVKWIVFDGKNVVKFEGDDTTYNLGDKVLNDDKNALKYGAVEIGDSVEVGIVQKYVNFIKKTESASTPKDEPQAEGSSDEVEKVVKAKTGEGEAIKFEGDGDKVWHPVLDKVQPFVKALKKGDVVKVKVGKVQVKFRDKAGTYPKDGIVFIQKCEAPEPSTPQDAPETPPGKTSTPPSRAKSTNSSIEAQCAYKGAIELTKAFIEKDKISVDIDLETFIKKFTKIGIEAINQ